MSPYEHNSISNDPVATTSRQIAHSPDDYSKLPLQLVPNPIWSFPWPDHTQLPDEDGTFVKNFQEHPQSMLLTDSLTPILHRLHPDGQYAIGQDSGIYWAKDPNPTRPLAWHVESPDWYYIANVPPMLEGRIRRSYVLWHEQTIPTIVIEFVSGNRDEEHDATLGRGKFWFYEQAIHVPYYAIFNGWKATLEVYRLAEGQYQAVLPNGAGVYPIEPMGVGLGLWHGWYDNMKTIWVRWWDSDGNILPTSTERAEQECWQKEQALANVALECDRAEQALANVALEHDRAEQALANVALERDRAEQALANVASERDRAEQALANVALERDRAEQERNRAERLEARLRELGLDLEGSETPFV